MVAVPPSGSLVTRLGWAHANLGMEPMHPKVKEYMKGYKEYSLTVPPNPDKK